MNNITVTNKLDDLKEVLNNNGIKFYEFESYAHYSIDLSEMYYDDFISNASGECDVQRLNSSLYVLYGDNVSRDDNYYNEKELSLLSIDDLLEIAELNNLYHFDEESDKDDIISDLLNITYEDYYNNYESNTSYNDIDYDYSISGYSQGDYMRFIEVGNLPKFINREYLHNIFFDAPIDGAIDIKLNGEAIEEIYLGEYLDSEYKWDKDLFIERISKLHKDEDYINLLIEYLENNLPAHLDYK